MLRAMSLLLVPGREYACHVTSLHDGDTVTVTRRLLNNLLQDSLDIRLVGINAPELVTLAGGKRSPNLAGEVASLTLMSMLAARELWSPIRSKSTFGIPGDYLMTPGYEATLVLRTDPTAATETEKYGRILGMLVPLASWHRNMSDADFWAASLNKAMLDQGQAIIDGVIPPW